MGKQMGPKKSKMWNYFLLEPQVPGKRSDPSEGLRALGDRRPPSALKTFFTLRTVFPGDPPTGPRKIHGVSGPAFGTNALDNDFFEIRNLARHSIIATGTIRWCRIHLIAQCLFGNYAHLTLPVIGFKLQ
jgi:hypothetical protein